MDQNKYQISSNPFENDLEKAQKAEEVQSSGASFPAPPPPLPEPTETQRSFPPPPSTPATMNDIPKAPAATTPVGGNTNLGGFNGNNTTPQKRESAVKRVSQEVPTSSVADATTKRELRQAAKAIDFQNSKRKIAVKEDSAFRQSSAVDDTLLSFMTNPFVKTAQFILWALCLVQVICCCQSWWLPFIALFFAIGSSIFSRYGKHKVAFICMVITCLILLGVPVFSMMTKGVNGAFSQVFEMFKK